MSDFQDWLEQRQKAAQEAGQSAADEASTHPVGSSPVSMPSTDDIRDWSNHLIKHPGDIDSDKIPANLPEPSEVTNIPNSSELTPLQKLLLKDQPTKTSSSPSLASTPSSEEDDNTPLDDKTAKPSPSAIQQLLSSPKQDVDLSDTALYGKDADNAALKAAIGKRNTNQAMANLGSAADTIANAFVSKTGATPTENNFYDKLKEQAGQPVQDVQQMRKNALEQQDMEAKILKNATDKDKVSPNSDISKLTRDNLKEMAKQAGMNVQIPDSLSAADVEKIQPTIEKYMQNKYNKDVLLQQKSAQASEKSSKTQEQNFYKVQAMLESNRNNNPEVSQAYKDRYAASKALPLINKYNPDKLTPQQIQLVVSEISKIAQGGVPTHSEMEALTPNTLASKFAGITQQITNHPTSANVGEFVKQYKDYLNDLNNNANRVINEKIGRVLESNKSHIGDTNYNILKSQFDQVSQQKSADKDNSHPQDDEAIKWAKANPGPDADAILKANGL